MSIKCDVLVVGAGPAGSSAARSAALNGAETILIEKKEEVGRDVKCAEGIGKYLFPYLPFTIPKEQLIWKIDGMLFSADGITVERTRDKWEGYSINRGEFDKWLSYLAVKSGANLWTNAELTDFEFKENNYVKKAIVKRNGRPVEILPKVVIAADGVESTVLKLLGLYKPKRGDLAEVYSWEMNNLNLFKPHLEQIFTGSFTPGGYAYIFPKSKNTANIGVGGIFPEKKLESYFEEFLDIPHVKGQVKNAGYVADKSKKAVFNDLTEEWIYGNVILSGDVANQNLKPFIEGILPSIICGNIAGKLAYDQKDGKNMLDDIYKSMVNKVLGDYLQISNELLDAINYLYSKKEKIKYLQFFWDNYWDVIFRRNGKNKGYGLSGIKR